VVVFAFAVVVGTVGDEIQMKNILGHVIVVEVVD